MPIYTPNIINKKVNILITKWWANITVRPVTFIWKFHQTVYKKRRTNNQSNIYKKAFNAIVKGIPEPRIQTWLTCLISWQWPTISKPSMRLQGLSRKKLYKLLRGNFFINLEFMDKTRSNMPKCWLTRQKYSQSFSNSSRHRICLKLD